MKANALLSRLKASGWRENASSSRHLHLRHPDLEGAITLPTANPSRGKSLPEPALAILSRRKQAMPCYYAAFLPEEAGCSVLFPDVPGCQTNGGTPEEAFAMAVDALSGHLEALAAADEPLPEPSDYPTALARLRALCEESGIPLPEGDIRLQLVPALEQESTLIRVSVSFRKSTLAMIDRKAEAAGMTRSGFLAAAAARCAPPPRE